MNSTRSARHAQHANARPKHGPPTKNPCRMLQTTSANQKEWWDLIRHGSCPTIPWLWSVCVAPCPLCAQRKKILRSCRCTHDGQRDPSERPYTSRTLMYLGSRTLGERDRCMLPVYSSIVVSTLLTNFLRILGSYSFSPFVKGNPVSLVNLLHTPQRSVFPKSFE